MNLNQTRPVRRVIRVVIRDAGYLLFNPDGSVAVIHGPHPQLEGDPAAIAALCAALS
jgi:hypothetical protein